MLETSNRYSYKKIAVATNALIELAGAHNFSSRANLAAIANVSSLAIGESNWANLSVYQPLLTF